MLPKGKLYPHEIRVLKTLVLMGYKDIDIAHSLGVSSAHVNRIRNGHYYTDVKPYDIPTEDELRGLLAEMDGG